MTNGEIIYGAIAGTYNAEEIHKLLLTTYTEDAIANARAQIEVKVEPGQDPEAAKETFIAANLFHTFQYWKNAGYSVKKGEHAAVTCYLWKVKKPTKAEKEAEKELTGGADPESVPSLMRDYYKTKAHLFHIGQVQKSETTPNKTDYNKMLKDQRVPV